MTAATSSPTIGIVPGGVTPGTHGTVESRVDSILSMEGGGNVGIDSLINLLREFHTFTGASWSEMDMSRTAHSIKTGLLLLKVKQLVKKKHRWEPWAVENLSFIGERTRQVYMSLARVSGTLRHACLGLDRLQRVLKLIGKEERGHHDPIGHFLVTKHGIAPVDPDKGRSLDQYKLDIDVLLASLALKKAEVTDVANETVEALVKKEVRFLGRFANEAKAVQDRGQSPDAYFQARIRKETAPVEITEEVKGAKLAASLHLAFDRLTSLIDKCQEEGQAVDLDEDKVSKLLSVLISRRGSDKTK